MATKNNNSPVPTRSRPQTRLATAKMLLENNDGGSGAENPDFIPPPPLFKPTNEYDRMMYEVFFCGDDGGGGGGGGRRSSRERSGTALDDNNNNRRRKSATRVSIMEPDTRAAATRKKKLLLNQATIPEKGETAPTPQKDNNVNNTASGRVSGKGVLAAKDHFRLALNQRAKELGLPMINKAVSSKKPKAQGKAKKKAGQKSNSSISSSSSSSPCDIYAQSFSTYIPFSQKKNLVVYNDADQPAVFLYADNLPKYEHKLMVLRGRGQAAKGAVKSGRGKTNSSSSFSVTPYQIGRMWADEHFPRALNKQRAEPPPPPFPTDPASGGLYDEKEEEGEEYRCQQQHWGTAYLPLPEPATVDPVTGQPINLRIPRAVRENGGCFSSNNCITDDQLLVEINSQADRPISELLAENRRRWAAVRGEHLAAHQENAARYRHSFAILEQMFRRQTLVVEEDRAEEAQEEEEEKEVSSGH